MIFFLKFHEKLQYRWNFKMKSRNCCRSVIFLILVIELELQHASSTNDAKYLTALIERGDRTGPLQTPMKAVVFNKTAMIRSASSGNITVSPVRDNKKNDAFKCNMVERRLCHKYIQKMVSFYKNVCLFFLNCSLL